MKISPLGDIIAAARNWDEFPTVTVYFRTAEHNRIGIRAIAFAGIGLCIADTISEVTTAPGDPLPEYAHITTAHGGNSYWARL